ncbi:MAG TPA: LPS-assembly protein LptD, partial [Deltaproteobacteria bacterium]|nr:LPS-assembly protein LptD [Deltaproteobacteria bacterium]
MNRFGTIIILVLVISLMPVPRSVFALDRDIASGPVHIEAERVRYISDPEAYEAEGDVHIIFKGGYLDADRVMFDVASSEAEAEGNVFIKSDGDTVEGSKARFNTITRQGVISQGTVFFKENHLFLRGETIEKRGENNYSLRSADVTSCCGENPDWKITGRKIDVTVDGYGTVRHGAFRVKDIPLIYVPYMVFPAKTTRQTGFLPPRWGFSSDKLGWDIGIPFYWAVSESADLTFYQRYMDKRGFQEGVELRYCLGEHSFGTFYT